MTWLLMLAGQPRAEGNSNPHHYKEKYKNEGPFENMSFSKKPLDFGRKKHTSSLDKQHLGTHGP